MAGFETGDFCGWESGQGGSCDVEDLLREIDQASSQTENVSALTSALTATLETGFIPDELKEAIEEASEVFANFSADSRNELLTIGEAHRMALIGIDGPSVGEALARLTPVIEAAYSDPSASNSKNILLMFSAESSLESPLPLSEDTHLTFIGSVIYAQWLFDSFPSSYFSPAGANKLLLSPTLCRTAVGASSASAIAQIVVRNIFVMIYRIASGVLNSAEAIVNCSTGGVTDTVAGVVLDAVEGCILTNVVDWIEVQADAQCLENAPELPLDWFLTDAIDCAVGAVPCVGDVWAVVANAIGVVQSVENLVNGICSVITNHEPLYDACDSCSSGNPDFVASCGGLTWKGFSSCFDPTNATPQVSCPGGISCPASTGNGTIKLTGGSLAGQALSASEWEITVSPGQPITGTVQCETDNFMGSNAVAPFGYTWTWGTRETAIVGINGWIPTGKRQWSVPISLTAPTSPGTYYILFAFNGEFNMSQVLSCDNWSVSGIIWHDGNDYFDMDPTRLEFAHSCGFVRNWRYRNNGGYRDWEVPALPVKVVVD